MSKLFGRTAEWNRDSTFCNVMGNGQFLLTRRALAEPVPQAQTTHAGTGAPQAQAAAVAGTGAFLFAGAGALHAQSAAVAGVGILSLHGAGALQAQNAAVAGIGVAQGLKTGAGALQAQDAAVSGAGEALGTVTVPLVVGLLLADAEAAIIAAGLTVGTITDQLGGTTVFSQDPTAFAVVPAGTPVNLTV